MAIIGELSDVGVPDLIDLFTRLGQTGKLTIKADGHEVQLYLQEGRLVLVTSSNLALRLGRMLIRLGVLTSQQLLEVLHDQAFTEQGQSLGSILLKRSWVTETDLARCVEDQCIEVLARVITARDGSFVFSSGALPPPHLEPVPLQADQILREATRRTEDLRHIRRLLPAPTTPLLVDERVYGTAGLSATEAQVARVLRTGAGCLADLSDQLALDELTLGCAVLGLQQRGIVVIAQDAVRA